MKQFLFLFFGQELKPDDGSLVTQEYMRKWGAWMERLAGSGAV